MKIKSFVNILLYSIGILAMRPQKIDVIADYIYVTLYNHTIYKFNKNGLEDGIVVLHSQHIATDIVVLHPLKQNVNGKCVRH